MLSECSVDAGNVGLDLLHAGAGGTYVVEAVSMCIEKDQTSPQLTPRLLVEREYEDHFAHRERTDGRT